ncbi:rod-binding protein [Bradyrhizobium sp. CCGUVB1N3]|uniref:rod-binding protein n=1 Tax=Bradyrhizobium sp. CCGUVB1N3 TaxID=2949629 RepID=UPI0020B31E69|nr:rod-binding protein [Bradyrhizobium sp. CCGUVB1N3]MCP3472665.1 rod-binding protein [Bradyrhizobium sp. CCGUVB1N3]
MIVTPTPDVVLDVLEAADPVTQRAAIAKLDALKSSGTDFAATETEVARVASVAGDQAAAKPPEASLDSSNAVAPVRVIKAPSSGDVYRKFEAFVLQVFVETMLPQNAQDLFGKGTAGGIWRSMLAEQLGNQLAQGKGIGIARQLAAAHPASADGKSGKAG